MIFINLNIVFWGDNSYYPIKFDIFLYIIPYNTVIFNQNPQNFIISRTIVPPGGGGLKYISLTKPLPQILLLLKGRKVVIYAL